jgi:hypothetical protein
VCWVTVEAPLPPLNGDNVHRGRRRTDLSLSVLLLLLLLLLLPIGLPFRRSCMNERARK